MGGTWVDYDLMSTIPGLYVLGEANFSDHGANRLGASALMQGLADGYFVLPATLSDYLAQFLGEPRMPADHAAFQRVEREVRDGVRRLLAIDGTRTVDSFHRELGSIMWEHCGMSRTAGGLQEAMGRIRDLREEYWSDLKVVGSAEDLNMSLEKAGRVGDYFELADLMCRDALMREESAGGHFREEHQSEEGEALRNDEAFAFVGVWEHGCDGQEPKLHREWLDFEYVKPAQRIYK
jgi:succinate dehydrogenase / fumarate reductase, flavoprotein subunit